MKGLKIRTLESPMQIEFWSATGANATPIAFTELYAAYNKEQLMHRKHHFH